MTRLAELTTLRVGGPAGEVLTVGTEADLVSAVRGCDSAGTPLLVVGGGSNLLVGDRGFDGVVLRALIPGTSIIEERDHVIVTAWCGEAWDDVVAFAVGEGWAGIEALSGIPGLVGATPIQNVGAYGQEVGDVISNVRVLDRDEGAIRDLSQADCAFGYRDSRFTHEPSRFIVLAVSYRLSRDTWSIVRYAQLADALGIDVGAIATTQAVRDAVLALRRSKGMVLDPDDPDTASAGSFFTNPVLSAVDADALPPECPRYPSALGVKVSAAWLIEQAGIGRGWQLRASSGARVSTKHTLALTNAGGATADDILELARAIRDRVEQRFGVRLGAEPTLVSCVL